MTTKKTTKKSIGQKHDKNKPRWSLLPWKEISDIVEVLTAGANKYEQVIDYDSNCMLSSLEEELELCNNVLNVSNIKLSKTNHGSYVRHATTGLCDQRSKKSASTATEGNRYSAGTCAETAMISGSRKPTQATEIINDETTRNGTKKTVTGRSKTIESEEEKIQCAKPETDIQNSLESLKREGSQRKQETFYWQSKKIDAQYAKEALKSAPYILIMSIQQNWLEDIYVVGATTDLECLATLLKVLKEQYDIYRTLQHISIQNGKIVIKYTGDNNWMYVKPRSRYIDALFRHLTAWLDGEKDDPEDSFGHLAHAGCCLLFLMWADNNDSKEEK